MKRRFSEVIADAANYIDSIGGRLNNIRLRLEDENDDEIEHLICFPVYGSLAAGDYIMTAFARALESSVAKPLYRFENKVAGGKSPSRGWMYK